ncbi:enoyl-CoA delta isomerase 1, mitochondrial-like [Antedon mediterranea]|uniref:enoyl-CoA delta isomerase 1, mitochondrial-like n=1 Tax=Antedon mediterranea TaxID=105859 RepID=UPI003AF42ED4
MGIAAPFWFMDVMTMIGHRQMEISLQLDDAREISKQMMRKKTIDKLRSRQEEDIAHFTNFFQKDSIQNIFKFEEEKLN